MGLINHKGHTEEGTINVSVLVWSLSPRRVYKEEGAEVLHQTGTVSQSGKTTALSSGRNPIWVIIL